MIGTERNIGLCNVPGFINEHDTYRIELARLYRVMPAVKILEKIENIQKGVIWI